MDRLFRCANALLFVVLVAAIGWTAPARIGDSRSADGPSRDGVARLLSAQTSVSSPFVLDLGRDVVPQGDVGKDATDDIVRLEPDTPVQVTWVSTRRLRIAPRRDLPRARRIHVHVSPELRDLAGQALPRAELFIDTPGPRITSLVSDDVRGGGAHALVVSFDMAVDVAALDSLLTVHALDEDDRRTARLAVEIAREPTPRGEHAVRVRLPDTNLPDRVELRVVAGLMPERGEVALAADWARIVELRTDLHVTGTRPTAGSIHLELSHSVPLPTEEMIAIDPPIAFQVVRRWDALRLVGEFAPGATYRVHLHAGFPGSGQVTLSEDVERSVRMPDAQPRVEIAERGVVLSSLARRELAVRSINVGRVEISARPVYANNVVRLVQRGSGSEHVCGPWVSKEIAIAAPRNEEARERVSLDGLLGTAGRGFHEIRVRDLADKARPRTRLVQITDLGATVRATRDAVLVRVTSIASGEPVEGADVTVLTPTNQVLVRGESGADGVAVLRFERTGADREPYLVDVRSGADRTFVNLDGFAVELAGENQGGRPYADGVECHIAFDRGAFRPGEPVHATVTARSPRGVSPVGVELEARWTAPGDRVHASERFTVPDSGLVALSTTLDGAATTGTWRLDVVRTKGCETVGRATFSVDAFVPDRIEASVRVGGPLTLGKTATIEVDANWLEGGGAGDRPVRAVVRLDHAPPASGDLAGFSFARIHEDEAVAPPGTLPVLRATLGPDGHGLLRVTLPDEDAADGQVFQATVRVEVQDPSGRSVRAGANERVVRDGPLLAVRAAGDELEVRVVDRDGAPIQGPAVANVTFERRHWRWRTVDRSGGRFAWETYVEAVPAHTAELRVTDGIGRMAIPDLDAGDDWIVAAVRMQIGEREVRADAPVGTTPARPDRLRVTAPAGHAAAGSTVPLRIASPVAGSVLVTIEGPSIHGHVTARVTAGETVVDVPLPEELDVPNVHLIATLVAGQARQGTAPPYWIVGGTTVDLLHDERVVDVAVLAPDQVLPGADVAIGIHARGATRATIALVDEGILRLTSHASPDPAAHFLARRRLETRGADSGTRLFDEPAYDAGALFGGDGAPTQVAARLAASSTAVVQTVSLWSGVVTLDSDGIGEATFRLPPYEGRLRAMVVAAGPERVGGGDASVVVRGPLGLRVAAPKRLSPGDVALATVTIRNATGAAGDLRLGLGVSGGIALGDGAAAERTVHLDDDATMSLDVPLRATSSDDGRIVATVTLGDASRRADATVLVRPLGLYVNLRRGVALRGEGTLEIPGTWADGTRRARLQIGSGPGAELLPALDALLEYPHGCAEQTSSRALAVLAARTLLDELDPELAAQADDMIRHGIDRLRGMQLPSGGIAYWPGGRWEWKFASAQTLDFLLAARDAGFQVDEHALFRLARHAERSLAEQRGVGLRSFSAEALSRAGVAVGPWLTPLAEDATQTEDRALLALAFARAGDAERARALVAPAPVPDAPSADGTDGDDGEASDILRSPTRARALLLRALLAADPHDDRIPALVAGLRAEVVSPEHLTTQSQMHAIRALGAWYAADAAQIAAATGEIVVDGVARDVAGSFACEIPDGARVTYALGGELTAFLDISGVRLDAPTPAHGEGEFGDTGLAISRRVIDIETGRQVTQLRRGGAYDVRLTIRSDRKQDHLLVTDLLPGGAEARRGAVALAGEAVADELQPSHADVRDDRVMLHVDDGFVGSKVLRYRLDGVFPGTYDAPPPIVEALYAPASATRGVPDQASPRRLEIVE